MSRLYSPLMQSEPAIGAVHQFPGQGTGRHFYLPRLDREHYQGDAVIHWTMPIARRGIGWLNESFHARFREVMLDAAAREVSFARPIVSCQITFICSGWDCGAIATSETA
jgi:hypothetical protein